MFPDVFVHHILGRKSHIEKSMVPAILNDFTCPIVDFVVHFMASLERRDGKGYFNNLKMSSINAT